MTDYVLPPALDVARVGFQYIDSTGMSRAVYTGVPQTTNYGGDRIGATIEFTPAGGASSAAKAKRRQLIRTLMLLRGQTNRIYLVDNSYVQAGSFPAIEVLLNADFSSGTTSWTPGSEASLSSSDGIMRVKRTANAGAGGNAYATQPPLSMTVNAPYVWRTGVSAIQGTVYLRATCNAALFYEQDGSSVTLPGYRRTWLVGEAGTSVYLDNTGNLVSVAGDYFDASFASCSRCMLADGGGNLFLSSDAFSGSDWIKNKATSGANLTVAPDGTATADTLIEDNTSGQHNFQQSSLPVTSASTDVCFSVAIKASTRTFVELQIAEVTGLTVASQYFNLTTKAVGTNGATGANWINRRAFTTDLGNGWVLCTLIARKTNAATAVTCYVLSATADGTNSYLGTSVTALSAWRGTLSTSSFPSRLRQTTTVPVAASAQSGIAINVKGLPVSTAGLLTASDQVEIDGQIKFLTAPLDSDAAGLGYLQFSPPLRRAVSDNTPVIVYRPMGRFMLGGNSSGWMNEPGIQSTASLELEEAFG